MTLDQHEAEMFRRRVYRKAAISNKDVSWVRRHKPDHWIEPRPGFFKNPETGDAVIPTVTGDRSMVFHVKSGNRSLNVKDISEVGKLLEDWGT